MIEFFKNLWLSKLHKDYLKEKNGQAQNCANDKEADSQAKFRNHGLVTLTESFTKIWQNSKFDIVFCVVL